MSIAPPLSLRAHHLLCALTFRGRGYGPNFVEQFSSVVEAIGHNTPLQLTVEADQLCNSGQNCGLCRSAQSEKRDILAKVAIKQAIGVDTNTPFQLDKSHLAQLRHAFAAGDLRQACTDCAWNSFCSAEANRGFARSHWQPIHEQ
ncbi:MAG: DUF1284 domain-containing protein [Granulosicoccaceae bacterium]